VLDWRRARPTSCAQQDLYNRGYTLEEDCRQDFLSLAGLAQSLIKADASPVAVMAGPEPDHPAARTFLHTLRALDYVTMACPEPGWGQA
jgi:hypothetical protein